MLALSQLLRLRCCCCNGLPVHGLLTPEYFQLHLLHEQLPEGCLLTNCHKACLRCRLMRARLRSLKNDHCMLRASMVVLLAHQLSAIKRMLSSVQLDKVCNMVVVVSLRTDVGWWCAAGPAPSQVLSFAQIAFSAGSNRWQSGAHLHYAEAHMLV